MYKDIDIVRKIAENYFSGRKNFTIRKLGEGDNNINYLVENNTAVVVKLPKPDYEYKALTDYKKEEWCLFKAHELRIPSPRVLKIGKQAARVFMILSYIEGSPVANLDDTSPFSEKDKLKAWKRLGEYTRKINSVRVKGWGETMTQNSVFNDSWERHIQYNIDSLNDDDILISMKVLSKKLSKKIKILFESLRDKEFTFGLCHSDIALRNTIMNEKGEIFLLDWGTARAEIVPHFDINEILRASKPDKETLRVFLDGYGITDRAFLKMKPDLVILDLLHEIDTLRWAIDKMPNVVAEHVKRVKIAIRDL